MVQHDLIVVLGPTASGKSSLGVTLAKRYGGIVISADSRQVYRGMNIGTGKITRREMSGIRHELLDVTSPRSQYSVARYVKHASAIINKTPVTTPIFLVGGTPFYIDALTKPNAFSAVPPNPSLRRQLVELSSTALMKRLRTVDPARALSIDQHNRRRIIRAIEIATTKHAPVTPTLPPLRILKIGISLSQEKLYRRIDRRVDERMRHGMVTEVRRLHRAGLSWKRLDSFGLEYRYLSRYLQGDLSKTMAVSELKTAIHHFAKRQMTWWKRDQEILWVSQNKQAITLINKFLTTDGSD